MSSSVKLRCAVYTRKSSDEGLDQAFNSLHAQREACEAFVKSQAGEGWVLREERYDDGGYSGGSMDRPGLRRLLTDIANKKVAAVVVYKVDRLTRSLTDFARIIEAFDKAGVSFVSVTQAFNTTTSMGRLTLNVLLSFAQFEREVTGERIRDKIAASKAKGMWMGGLPPLGYDPPLANTYRALVVNEDEAKAVRQIFVRCLEVRSLPALQKALQQDSIRSKRWVTAAGRWLGGLNFSRGALRHLLTNRIYLGEIGHKGERFVGRHKAIVNGQTFDAVQAVLTHRSNAKKTRIPKSHACFLHGLIFDGDGHPMQPIVAARRGKPSYRYYASAGGVSGDNDAIYRVPANAVETLAAERIAGFVGVLPTELGAADIRALLFRLEVHSSAVHLLLRNGASIGTGVRITLERLRREGLPGDHVSVEPRDTRVIRVVLPVRLKVRGGRTWRTNLDGSPCPQPQAPDARLIQHLRAAHALIRACGAQPESPLADLRYARAPKNTYQLKLARWAFLAPDIQEAILDGRINGLATKAIADIPLSWAEQRRRFGVSDRSTCLR